MWCRSTISARSTDACSWTCGSSRVRIWARCCASGPLPPQRAIKIIEQIALALFAAHRIGLVHRDVKPSNILVTEDDFAYLIDFGIARVAGEAGLTDTGAAVGTWAYMAPERFSTGAADARADVYALTCVLYEALTGESPFPAKTLEQIATAHMLQPPPLPSTFRPQIPQAMDQVITTGMAKEPDQRYASTKDLATAARAAVGAEQDRTQAAQQDRTQAAPPPWTAQPTEQVNQPGPTMAGPPRGTHRASASAGPGAVRRRNPVPSAGGAGSARAGHPAVGSAQKHTAGAAAAVVVVIVAVAAMIMFTGDSDSPSSGTASSPSSPLRVFTVLGGAPHRLRPAVRCSAAPSRGPPTSPEPRSPNAATRSSVRSALRAGGAPTTGCRSTSRTRSSSPTAARRGCQVVGTEDYCCGGPDCDAVPAEMPVPENANIGGSPDLQCDITGNTEGQGDCQLLVVDRDGREAVRDVPVDEGGRWPQDRGLLRLGPEQAVPGQPAWRSVHERGRGRFPDRRHDPHRRRSRLGLNRSRDPVHPAQRSDQGRGVRAPGEPCRWPREHRPQCAAVRRAVPAEGRLRRDRPTPTRRKW